MRVRSPESKPARCNHNREGEEEYTLVEEEERREEEVQQQSTRS
jgi:hypothetical protein